MRALDPSTVQNFRGPAAFEPSPSPVLGSGGGSLFGRILTMAREASPAFQFYPADFLADENVASMTAEERGVYITLLCICWREGSIPENPENLGLACGLNGKRMANAWQAVSKCFVPHRRKPKRVVHPRLERERKAQSERRKSRSEAGLRGAKARWQGHCGRNATAMANDGSSSSSSSSQGPDRDHGWNVSSKELESDVYHLCNKLGYIGEDAGNIWKIAALVSLRKIPEAAVLDAAQGCRECGPKDRPAYFWAIVKESLESEGTNLLDLVRQVRITPRCPTKPPGNAELNSAIQSVSESTEPPK